MREEPSAHLADRLDVSGLVSPRGAARLRDAWRVSHPILLAALSGALYAAASPGVGLWPFAFVCWVPFLLALDGRSARQAFALGLLQGVVTSVAGTLWILQTVKAMTGWGPALTIAGASVLWLYQGGRSALLGWLAARAARRGWPPGLAFGLAIAAVEVAYPMLFGWYGAIQVHNVPLLLQVADLGGPIAVSLGLAGANVAIAALALAWLGRRPRHGVGLVIAALCPALLVGYGALRVSVVEREMARAPRARVGVVQTAIGRRSLRAASAKRSMDLGAALVEEEHLDLLVWPEGAVRTAEQVRDLPDTLPARTHGRDAGRTPPLLLAGIETEDLDASGKKLSPPNSAVLFDANAGELGRYDKNRLVPFGEYVPFGDVFPVLYEWFPNSGPVARGDTPAPIPFGEHAVAALICYEDTLPGYANTMMQGGRADLLVGLSNDIWFGRTDAVVQHFALSKLRAVEHHRFLVRSGNTGISAIVDAAGRVVQRAPPFVPSTVSGEIAWMRGTTLYERIGDAPWWIAAAAILAMGAVPAPRRRRGLCA